MAPTFLETNYLELASGEKKITAFQIAPTFLETYYLELAQEKIYRSHSNCTHVFVDELLGISTGKKCITAIEIAPTFLETNYLELA